ncbi:MAG: ComEC/Rec2 family competence protein, partial [Actinomycetes bacterium]
MSLRSSTDLRLLVPAVACWLGAFVGTGAPGRWLLVACPLVMLGSALCWRRRALAAAAAGLSLGAGLAAAGLRVLGLLVGEVDELAAERASAVATLVVTADPRRHTSATSGERRGPELFIVAARLERATVRGREVRARAPVLLLATDRAWGGLLPGQRVGAVGRLGPARPGQPLAAVLSVRGPPAWVGGVPALQRAAGGLRAGLREAVDGLPPPERGLVPGLVVGDTSRMPPDLETDFRTAGMTHLTAVSGANLVIVAGFVLFAARWLGVRGRALPVFAALAIVGFVVLARPQPSVLRAAVMGLVGLAGLASGRRRASLAALAAAMFLLLLVDPWLARSYGFALSVLATAGLLVLAPGWARWLAGRGMPRVLAHALAVPLAAQVACAPVVVLLSGEVSLVAVPANLLAAPAVAPATVIGVLAVVAGAVSEPVATLLGTTAGVPAGWIVRVAEGAAAAPLAAVPWPSTALGALSLAGVSCLALLLARRAASYPRFVVVVAVAALGLALVTASRPGWPPRGWVIVACDVGQGDALVLSAGDAGVVMVDAGPDPRAVDACLDALGVSRVALVVLTHLHADHVEGLPGVLRGRSVGEIQVSPYS